MEFLADHRDQRKLAIGSLDITTTRKNIKRNERREKQLDWAMNPQPSTSGTIPNTSSAADSSSSNSSADNFSFERNLPDRMKRSTKKKYRHLKLPSVALVCDRTAACISSAVLKEIGMISKDDKSQLIDRNKIRRSRSIMKQEIKVTQNKTSEEPLLRFIFDRRIEQ